MEKKLKRVVVLLLAIPIILAVSDFFNMYTFNKIADKTFFLLGVILSLVVLIYSITLLVKAMKTHEKNKVKECIALTIYSFIYFILIWLTYVLSYCYLLELYLSK